MARRFAGTSVGILLVLLLAACSGGAMTDPTQPSPTRTRVQPALPTPTGEPVDVPDARWSAIVDDLAQRDVAGTPTLVSAIAVTWNDGALGCPKPGSSYTQAQIDGMQVIVTVDGVRYDYRFGNGDVPRLCGR
ncbi:hypothetical protein GCM10009775_20400 [Microbacterium aoyamense]|uniref:Lipoprotein n=1 Tax=Microbacterium aoyamense TaxID=344166 RepID=A0ABP5B2E8_9MICO|nr:hypothetical protein [Microbacterium aoyamense]